MRLFLFVAAFAAFVSGACAVVCTEKKVTDGTKCGYEFTNCVVEIADGNKCGYDIVPCESQPLCKKPKTCSIGKKCKREKTCAAIVTDGAKCGYEFTKCGVETITDGVKCGWSIGKCDGCKKPKKCSIPKICKKEKSCKVKIVDGAKCGYEITTCGVETITDGVKCGYDMVKCDPESEKQCKKPKKCSIEKTCKKEKTCLIKDCQKCDSVKCAKPRECPKRMIAKPQKLWKGCCFNVETDCSGMMCTSDYKPVCANGKTFSNACMAKAAGFVEMPTVVGLPPQRRLAAAAYFTPGACKRPCEVTRTLKPVCGSDGQTYSNPSQAKCAGVKRYQLGKCQEKVEVGFCKKPNGRFFGRKQRCKKICSTPTCAKKSQCAMRKGDCCDYRCLDLDSCQGKNKKLCWKIKKHFGTCMWNRENKSCESLIE